MNNSDNKKPVATRIAPSPTGALHIGGARTALFNFLFSKHYGGKFFLRIEDTDLQRSDPKFTQSILNGLKWLGIEWDAFSADEEIVYQSKRTEFYKQAINKLLDEGKAYRCFVSPDEVEKMREQCVASSKSFVFRSPWRDKHAETTDSDNSCIIRLKTPISGQTVISDMVRGEITFDNSTIEDFALARSDLTPLYNLCVVCDDHQMGITHIIRGDDHITNAVRQKLLYQALGWEVPEMAHIPLIHGPDGTKLSKRHGATSVEEYKKMGYLPESIINYLLRLGWSYEGEEIISLQKAIEMFNIENVGKSPSRIDFAKMNDVNAHYIRQADNNRLAQLVVEYFDELGVKVDEKKRALLEKAMEGLKARNTLVTDLAEMAAIYIKDKLVFSSEAKQIIKSVSREVISKVINLVESSPILEREQLSNEFKSLAKELKIKLADLMQPLRCLMAGKTVSPSVFEMIELLGKDETLNRLKQFENL